MIPLHLRISCVAEGGNFVAHLGHDLRGHLTAIVGFSRLISRRGQLSDKDAEGMSKILAGAENMLQLVNTMVDLAKLESDLLELYPEPVDVSELLDKAIARVQPKAHVKGLIIQRRWSDLPTSVAVDAQRLYQVLLQLLDNAVSYSEHGSVTLAARCNNSCFTFTITDTGPGIVGRRLAELLEALPPVPDATGAGLGIAYSKALLELMGGSLSANSTPGVGSEFQVTIELPILAADATQVATDMHTREVQLAYPVPPAGVLQQLADLALQGDIKAIMEQVESLRQKEPDYNEFASEVSSLAKSFQINKISELLMAVKTP